MIPHRSFFFLLFGAPYQDSGSQSSRSEIKKSISLKTNLSSSSPVDIQGLGSPVTEPIPDDIATPFGPGVEVELLPLLLAVPRLLGTADPEASLCPWPGSAITSLSYTYTDSAAPRSDPSYVHSAHA